MSESEQDSEPRLSVVSADDEPDAAQTLVDSLSEFLQALTYSKRMDAEQGLALDFSALDHIANLLDSCSESLRPHSEFPTKDWPPITLERCVNEILVQLPAMVGRVAMSAPSEDDSCQD